MSKSEQLPFDLGPRQAHLREDFQVSRSNSDAVAWLDRYPAWPAPALVIHGPPASGKTHLLQVWRKEAGAAELTAAQLTPATVARALGTAKAVIVDKADVLMGLPAAEEALLHVYNMMKERDGFMLLAAVAPVAAWKIALPDLRSRLMAAPAAALGPPDDALMAVVLSKMFSDRQIFVSQDVVDFIIPRAERSFAALRDLVERIDRKALAEKRAVTVPLVRDLL